jgi:ADP-heptose:LPS heptosyltransferase
MLDDLHAAGAVPFSVRGHSQVRLLQAWLRSRSFDLALTILGDQFGVVLKRAGIPIRVGVLGSPLASCHTHTYDIGSARSWGPNERLKALSVLGHVVEDAAPRAWVSESARASTRAKLLARGLNEAQPYVAIHPFGSTPRQWWPLDRVEQLSLALAKRGLRSVLIGGGETSRAVPAAVKLAVIDVTGGLSIQELLALIDGARAVVTTDSGPFHIAGALRRPTLGLFRASRPEHGALYSTATVVLEAQPDCAQQCRWDRCRLTPCRQMVALPAERVLQAFDHLMATASA